MLEVLTDEERQELSESVAKIENKIGYTFKDKSLPMTALTHSSMIRNSSDIVDEFQRLEFLGDAILQYVTSYYLFTKYKTLPEGDLTLKRSNIVYDVNLARASTEIGLDKYILIGNRQNRNDRPSRGVLCDAYEAMLAAVYCDGGINEAKKFIVRFAIESSGFKEAIFQANDIKSELRAALKADIGAISYQIVSESGPPHAKRFQAVVVFEGRRIGSGFGKTKKEAEQKAAANVLKYLGNEDTVENTNEE